MPSMGSAIHTWNINKYIQACLIKTKIIKIQIAEEQMKYQTVLIICYYPKFIT